MILLPSSATFWIATQPVDFRRSFDVLVQLAREQTGKDIITQHRGAVVFFFNCMRDRCKAIFHDRTGVVILFKRLNEDAPTCRFMVSAMRSVWLRVGARYRSGWNHFRKGTWGERI